MPLRTCAAVLAATALVGIVTGCAGPSASSASSPVAAAFAPASELTGTWRGSFGWVGAFFYTDEGAYILRVKEDGTFTETVTPSSGPQNIAKASTWSGTAVVRGNRVTLRTSQGPWVTLVRSGNTLYGVAMDPVLQVPIMMKFDRDGSGT